MQRRYLTCKTNYSVTFVYDGVKSAKEVLTEAIIAQVRRKLDSDIEIIDGKEYNIPLSTPP